MALLIIIPNLETFRDFAVRFLEFRKLRIELVRSNIRYCKLFSRLNEIENIK